jgi:pimeloyl-ACP methyl ester carboxylesterase
LGHESAEGHVGHEPIIADGARTIAPVRRRITGLVMLAGLVAAGGCSDSPDAATPTTADRPTTTLPVPDEAEESAEAGSITWTPCGGQGDDSECGTLEVALDHDDPAAGIIPLSLVRVPAADPARRIGPLLVNPGGPGGTGVDFARFFPFPNEINNRFDIIGFDPRGVGASGGLTCGGDLVDQFFAVDSDPDAPAEQADLDRTAQAVADDCSIEDGDVLPHVGSVNVARDMDAIRQALGEEQISFLGFSYGTRLGALYAEMFPERTRAIVLDGVFDPAHDFVEWLTEQTGGFERAVAGVFSACPDDPSCPPAGAAAAYDQVLAAIETTPLPAGAGRLLGPSDLATAALYVTYDEGGWPELYAGLSDALAGDGTRLYDLADGYRSFGSFTQYAAVMCVDSAHPAGPLEFQAFAAGLEAISPRFGAAVANELLPCAYWPVTEVGDPQPVVAAGAPPILVVGNTGDAATPFEQAQRVADTLESGVLLTHEGVGHTSFRSGSSCVDEVIERYLVDLAVPAEGTVCR